METFADIVGSRAGDDAVGLRFGDWSWTWAEVVQESADRAAALRALVPPPRGRQRHVGVLLDNVPDYVFWVGAGALAGAVVVGLNAGRPGAELADDIRHADIDLLVTESRLLHLVTGRDHGLPADRVLDVDHAAYVETLAPFRGSPPSVADLAPGDVATLLFSSGSTGRPKAVIVTHGRLARLAVAMAERVEMTRESVAYLAMPLFHGNALMMNLVPAMLTGATVVLCRRFSTSRFCEDVHRFGVTYVNYVGRALSYVLSAPEDLRDARSTLRVAFGTEASAPDIARFSQRFGCRVHEGYGLTEGVLRIVPTADTPSGSLGLPVDGAEVKILDATTGRECPRARLDGSGRLVDPAALGQIVVIGGARRFEGYYRNPSATAERVRGEDFWTGDLGYRDEDGWFYFAGRTADLLRVDSENFAAVQVERVLRRFGGVGDVAVYPVPDARTGDRVMCALEMDPRARFDPGAFGDFLAAQPDLGAKWWPTYVRITAALPATANSKVAKPVLRQEGWDVIDPVYVRLGRTAQYAPFGRTDREALETEFRAHGRFHLVPMAAYEAPIA